MGLASLFGDESDGADGKRGSKNVGLLPIFQLLSVADPGGATVQMHPPSKNPKKIHF